MALVIWEVLLVNKKHCGQPNEDELIYTESGYMQELYPIRSIVSIELVNDVPSIATVFTGIAFVTPVVTGVGWPEERACLERLTYSGHYI